MMQESTTTKSLQPKLLRHINVNRMVFTQQDDFKQKFLRFIAGHFRFEFRPDTD
jgi:hypothetical protein